MYTFLFTKENGDWYINFENGLKEFNNSEFVLLEGSTTLLDFLSNEKKRVTLALDIIPFDKALKLELTQICDDPIGGGVYQLKDHKEKVLKEKLWLSDLPLFVFGDIPDQIFLKREKCFSIQPVVFK